MQLICAHGWLMSPRMWDGIGNAVGIAQPGPPVNFSMEAWADWLVAEADRRGIEKAVYAGHSMGGYVVQHVWHRHPERGSGTFTSITPRITVPTLVLHGTEDEAMPFEKGN